MIQDRAILQRTSAAHCLSILISAVTEITAKPHAAAVALVAARLARISQIEQFCNHGAGVVRVAPDRLHALA